MSAVADAVNQLTARKQAAGFPAEPSAPAVAGSTVRAIWMGLDLNLREVQEVAQALASQSVPVLIDNVATPGDLRDYIAGVWLDAFATGVFYEREIREGGE